MNVKSKINKLLVIPLLFYAFTCLSFNRSPQGAYVMNDTGKYNIQKMNSQEIENFKKELKTKKWIQW